MKSYNKHRPERYREFYDSVGRLYPEEKLVYASLRGLLRRQFVLAQLKQFRGRFLDLGCNRGYYLSHYTNGLAVGVDLAHSVLQAAKERLPKNKFLVGDAQKLSFFKANTFDSILCSEMIEHVPDAQSVISECFKILKPKGNLLITTPNYRGVKPGWVDIGVMKSYGIRGIEGDKYYHSAFRPEELRAMAEFAGFQQIDAGTFEKEVKYATRIPVIFYHLISILNKALFRSRRIADMNETVMNKSSLFLYRTCNILGLNTFFLKLVKEGVRSYLFATK